MRHLGGGEASFRYPRRAGAVFGAVRGPVAVLLAFVIFLAFHGYTRAGVASRGEASAVLTVSRVSGLFPPATAAGTQGDPRLLRAPTPVWIVLALGGVMSVGYVAFFADPRERFLAQGVMMGTTVAVVASGLLRVAFARDWRVRRATARRACGA